MKQYTKTLTHGQKVMLCLDIVSVALSVISIPLCIHMQEHIACIRRGLYLIILRWKNNCPRQNGVFHMRVKPLCYPRRVSPYKYDLSPQKFFTYTARNRVKGQASSYLSLLYLPLANGMYSCIFFTCCVQHSTRDVKILCFGICILILD